MLVRGNTTVAKKHILECVFTQNTRPGVLMIRPDVFFSGRVFGLKTSGRVFYIKRHVYISNTLPGILHKLLKFAHEIIHVISDGPYIFIFLKMHVVFEVHPSD